MARRKRSVEEYEGKLAQMTTLTPDGKLEVDPKALDLVRLQQARHLTLSAVPAIQANAMRTAGGAGLERGHSSPQLPMTVLRQIRESSGLLQSIHAARHAQVQRMSQRWNGVPGAVGWHVYHKDYFDPTRDVPAGFDRYINAFETILRSPAPSYGFTTTADLLVPLAEDLLTINHPVVQVLHLATDPTCMVGLKPEDGGIIWPTLAWLELWRKKEGAGGGARLAAGVRNERELLEVASLAMDFTLFGAEYVLVRDGMCERAYTRDELIVAPQITRTDIRYAGYPPSKVDEAISSVIAAIDAFGFNHNFFTTGLIIDTFFAMSGDYTENDVQAFMGMLTDAATKTGRAHQVPVIPMGSSGDIKPVKIKDNPTDMAFETWMSYLSNQVLAVYRMDPSTVNIKPWGGGATGGLSEANRTTEIALAKEEGLQSLLTHIAAKCLEPAAQRIHPDLRVRFEFGDYDPVKAASVAEVRTRVDMTRNEARMERGQDPFGVCLTPKEYVKATPEEQRAHDANPWNWPTDASFATAMMAKLNPPPTPAGGAPGAPRPGGASDGLDDAALDEIERQQEDEGGDPDAEDEAPVAKGRHEVTIYRVASARSTS